MAVRLTRRLPGFRFEARALQLREALPRMDVAIFVGFAASGPLHWPVALEDFAQFTELFGAPAPLAWDEERGEQVTAYLAGTVREFFHNGGQRCWVVRVAGREAQANAFPVPGLVGAKYDKEGNFVCLHPAFAQARSEGSWSDALRVSAALLSQPLEVHAVKDEGWTLELTARAGSGVSAGDLLRLTFADDAWVLMLRVGSIESTPSSEPQQALRLVVKAANALWFETQLPASPLRQSLPVIVRQFSYPAADITNDAVLFLPQEEDDPFVLSLPSSTEAMPALGSVVCVRTDVQSTPRELWLTVQDVQIVEEGTSPPEKRMQVRGTGLWRLPAAPESLPAARPTAAEKLTFELRAREGDREAQQMTDLGFVPGHPRYWGDLPTDRQLYEQLSSSLSSGQVELAFEKEGRPVSQTKNQRRFPLAGTDEGTVWYFPLGMSGAAEVELSAVSSSRDPLTRDGLAKFGPELFLDPDLIEVTTTSFLAQADFLRYFSPSPRVLQGLHAAMGTGAATIIEEATLIAVPDAVHRGWREKKTDRSVAEITFPSLRHPRWWRFLPCKEREKAEAVPEPERGHFLDCDLRLLPAPRLTVKASAGRDDRIELTWEANLPDAVFIVEEAVGERTDEEDFREIQRTPEHSLTIIGRSAGRYVYRMRAELDCETSDWSKGVPVYVGQRSQYVLQPISEYSSDTLLTVQRALLRMCAGRSDLLAVLALPEHYREADAITYMQTLKAPRAAAIEIKFPADTPQLEKSVISLPLGDGEQTALSYAALYHPWIVTRHPRQSPQRLPPEGAVCGVMAARALARGAWIAPANEPLQDVLALRPQVARDRWLSLQEAQINLIRPDPRGFLALSADTLSQDEDLRPINVRRLLILLRRLALRQGAQYVFEPNDESFRRLVEGGFEAMLTEMFERGAFAGATPAAAFQVNAATPFNERQQEHGRFLVELKVAPSLPMTFLTIRVIQAGERTRVIEV